MNNREAMQKAFEGQKFKVFSPFKCDISKNENGDYVEDETIFAFAWFCRGIASQAQQAESNSASNAAMEYALKNHDLEFLHAWFHGNFNAIRKEWADAPETVFIGGDPLYALPPAPDGE